MRTELHLALGFCPDFKETWVTFCFSWHSSSMFRAFRGATHCLRATNVVACRSTAAGHRVALRRRRPCCQPVSLRFGLSHNCTPLPGWSAPIYRSAGAVWRISLPVVQYHQPQRCRDRTACATGTHSSAMTRSVKVTNRSLALVVAVGMLCPFRRFSRQHWQQLSLAALLGNSFLLRHAWLCLLLPASKQPRCHKWRGASACGLSHLTHRFCSRARFGLQESAKFKSHRQCA